MERAPAGPSSMPVLSDRLCNPSGRRCADERGWCLIAAGAVALVLASSAGATVHLLRLTSPVRAGGDADRELPRTVRCSITVT